MPKEPVSQPSEMVVSVFDAKSIELQPGHKYLLMLRGDGIEAYHIQRLRDELTRLGFDGLVVAMPANAEATIIEQESPAPAPKKAATEDKK